MEYLLEERDGRVAVLTLNRPEAANSIRTEMFDELITYLRNIANDRSVGAIVLTGAGRFFCAGADVKGMAARTEQPSIEERAWGMRDRSILSRYLAEIPQVTIAMINGPAAGAGLSLALACDMRIAADTAKLTTAFAKIGLSGDYGTAYFLTQIVGRQKARELMLFADTISTVEAERIGIVNRVVDAGSLREEAMKLAHRAANGAPVANEYIKKVLNAAGHMDFDQWLHIETWAQGVCLQTADHKEGSRAFVEKRAAKFTGR